MSRIEELEAQVQAERDRADRAEELVKRNATGWTNWMKVATKAQDWAAWFAAERDHWVEATADEFVDHQAAHARTAELEARLAAVRAFAEEMRGYCSPNGVAVMYADRLVAVVEGRATDGAHI